jgi:cytochrome b561/polyisoprenoid-binding protein YceI
MSLTNTPSSYGAVAKTLHWLTALGILLMLPLGLIAAEASYDSAEALARKATLFSLHKTLGVGLFLIALLRILWAVTQPKPAPLHPERRAEGMAAETVHWLLYGSLVAVPLSGWIHHAATDGFAPIWGPFGQTLPLVPKSALVAGVAAGLHHVFLWVLIAALGLHVAGAVKHHVIDRDATLRRMLPGTTSAGGGPRVRNGLRAPLVAALAWVLALGLGGLLGVYGQPGTAAQVAALQKVDSEWQVTEGTLDLRIRQFGQEVSGGFADWTAEISYDDSPAPGVRGAVTVQIAIGSVSLGSVTAQALGPDHFDAATSPTAVFDAEILRSENGLEAVGTLTLRGQEVPVTLPFVLETEGATARMTGSATLDRRSFGIGEKMTDPGQLGFDVQIDVALTAVRQDRPD